MNEIKNMTCENFSNSSIYVIFNEYWAKLAIESGFKLVRIDLEPQKRNTRNGVIFVFENTPEIRQFHQALINSYNYYKDEHYYERKEDANIENDRKLLRKYDFFKRAEAKHKREHKKYDE